MTIRELLNKAQKTGIADLDINILLAYVMGRNQVFLHTWPEHIVPRQLEKKFLELLQRRISGEPIAYILGQADFWDFTLQVNASVLIPRPETEQIIEIILMLQNKLKHRKAEIKILELGTGSGAIACALAKTLVYSKIIAIDTSAEALAVAEKNAALLKLNNIKFIVSNWFSALREKKSIKSLKFNYIVSNPPYIAPDDPHLQQKTLQFEPLEALVAVDNGYAALKLIIEQARQFLLSPGWLILEHGYQQGRKVRKFFKQFNYKKIITYKDLSQHERITIGCV